MVNWVSNEHKYVFCIFVLMLSVWKVVSGHGRLLEPPSRSSAFRFGFATPHNDNDNQLSCGGFGGYQGKDLKLASQQYRATPGCTNGLAQYWWQRLVTFASSRMQWSRNHGQCGICGDPFQGPRDNEAGGKYATGTIVRHYKKGQDINVKIEMTVGHGGWSEFRICPNNNIHKAATQQCLDKYLLATPDGETRISHPHRIGVYKYTLKLPRSLTCSQCVLQWKWNTDSNNNCNFITGKDCCSGCGPQEQFYGCSDISIEDASSTGYHVTSKATHAPNPPQGYVAEPTRPNGFLPIDIFGRNLNEGQ